MLEIKQTDTYRKWERKLRDQRGKALIAARIFRLANGLPGDVKPVGQGVGELRIHHGPGYRVCKVISTLRCDCHQNGRRYERQDLRLRSGSGAG